MRTLNPPILHPLLAATAAVAIGALALHLASVPITVLFIGGAARLTSLLTGVAAVHLDDGWALGFAEPPLLVTAMCSATDFFLLTTTLLGWHLGHRISRPAWLPVAVVGALVTALPVTIFVNALRLIAVAQAHRWAIPRLPPAYDAFLHMLTGIAVFLPALIALNLLLEIYGRSHSHATS